MSSKNLKQHGVTALVNADLFEVGYGRVIGARDKSGGRVEVGVIFLDAYCLGVVDAIFTVMPNEEFYARRVGDIDEARDMAGAALDPFNAQTEHSDTLLDLFENVVIKDTSYIIRLQKHYRMSRERIQRSPKRQALASETHRLPRRPLLD